MEIVIAILGVFLNMFYAGDSMDHGRWGWAATYFVGAVICFVCCIIQISRLT